jgi:hypothetical protein
MCNKYLSEFRNVDKAGEVLKIGALVVKLAQRMMLSIVSLYEGKKCIVIICFCLGTIVSMCR